MKGVADQADVCQALRAAGLTLPCCSSTGAFETDIYNDEARTNYTRFVSASSSPSRRAGAELLLANPFESSTLVNATVQQTHPYHRVYIVGAGRAVVVRIDEAHVGFATGTVEFADGSGAPSGGEVLLVLSETDRSGAIDPLGDRVTASVTVHNGRFAQEYRAQRAEQGQAVAHYLGTFGAAPADSDPVKVLP